jgi:hypothetical protein
MIGREVTMENKYCVYGHYGDDGICFYVGIGNKKRPKTACNRSKFWHNYVNKHCVSGKPEVKIWHQNLTWEQAKEHEIFWISVYGRRDLGTGCLVNLTDGGEGSFGRECKDETRQKIANSNTGKKLTEESKAKLSESLKGNTYNLGITHTKETRLVLGKGYSKLKNCNRWRARITILGVRKDLGLFPTEQEAAIAYNKALDEILKEEMNPQQPPLEGVPQ